MVERRVRVFKGWMAVASEVAAAVLFVVCVGIATAAGGGPVTGLFATLAVLLAIKVLVMPVGFFLVKPNQSKVLVQFGRYVGTVRDEGFWWTYPWRMPRRTISLRIRTFDSDTLKVNDAVGNPVEIASVINWQVTDTAKASFDVEDYENFVYIQTEAAVRHVASEYPYDNWDDETQVSLRGNADEVMATLQAELQERLDVAGVTVRDTRLRRLAYAQEIAGEMLRRQQATAVVAARRRIVEGAVAMVQTRAADARRPEHRRTRRGAQGAMVSNLLVVLCSDRGAQPVVNSGSLYQ